MAKLLFTGASGFIGQNVLPELKKQYSDIVTLGRSSSNDIKADLAAEVPDISDRFDIVLHCAGKAHTTPVSPEEKHEYFAVNLDGTKNLCRALEKAGVPRAFVFISSVSVYGRYEGLDIDESHPLKGKDAYAKSKILAEEYLQQWCKEHNVVLTILRASLIAGKNPPGNLGDMIEGISRGFYFDIAGGKAKKSLLMAEDIASLIPLVENTGGIYNVCASGHPTFRQLSLSIASQLGKRPPLCLPYLTVKLAALIGDIVPFRFPINSRRLTKVAKSLTFSNKKAVSTLGWKPLSIIENFKIR